MSDTRSYLLVETSVGKTREVVSRLRTVEGIPYVDMVTGPYDIVAVLETKDLNEVGNLVTEYVHVIPGILRTITCLAVSV